VAYVALGMDAVDRFIRVSMVSRSVRASPTNDSVFAYWIFSWLARAAFCSVSYSTSSRNCLF